VVTLNVVRFSLLGPEPIGVKFDMGDAKFHPY